MISGSIRSGFFVLVLVIAGCGHRTGSWAPLSSAGQRDAMTRTLAGPVDIARFIPRFAVHQQQLPSGLYLGTERSEARGMVGVLLAFGAGSTSDPTGKEGLAHLVEHLVYHARRPGNPSVRERLLRLGAHYNATTRLETTLFYEIAARDKLTALIELTLDRMQNPLLGVTEADFQRERDVVENELHERNELGVGGQVMGWMQASLFPAGHPWTRPIGGSQASLARLTLADARAFAATHYRPDNAHLLLAGELPQDAAAQLKLLPEFVRRKVTAKRPDPPAPWGMPAPALDDGERFDRLTASVSHPELWVAYNLGGGEGRAAALRKVLTTASVGRFVEDQLGAEDGVLGVEFVPLDLSRTTLLACRIVVDQEGRRPALARKARSLIWSMWSDRGPPASIARASWRADAVQHIREAALLSGLLQAEPFVDRWISRAHTFRTERQLAAYDDRLKAMAALAPTDVSSAAFDLLAQERARTLFIDPISPISETRARPETVAGLSEPQRLPPVEDRAQAALFGTPPKGQVPAELSAPSISRLANGVTLVVVPRRQFPAVTAILGFFGGRAALPGGLLRLIRAVEPRPAGATWFATEPLDGPGFTADLARADPAHVSNALYALAGRLRAVADTDWRRLLERHQREEPVGGGPAKSPGHLSDERVLDRLYGRHPYGVAPSPRELREMDPRLPGQWLPRLYQPQNAVLVVVGDVDVAAVRRLAEGCFGDWPAQAVGPLGLPAAPPFAPEAWPETPYVVHRPATPQTQVTFACRLPALAKQSERAAGRLLAELIGGYLTTRIREEAGATYDVQSAAHVWPGGAAHLAVELSVDNRRLRETLAILREHLQSLARGRLDPGALSQARWSLSRQAGLAFQSSEEIAARIVRGLTLGIAPAELWAEEEAIRLVGAEEVAKLAARCAEGPILSLVGDQAIVTEWLAADR
jgi:zinc protease